MCRKIVIGKVDLTSYGYTDDTPIEMFKMAYELLDMDNWTIYSNNPQFIEAVEVLHGEDNVDIYLKSNGYCRKISFLTAYGYLGDVYDIIDKVRGVRIANHLKEDEEFNVSEAWIKEEIDKYKLKYGDDV